MRKCKVRKFQLWQIFVCFNDFFSCQYFWRNVFCDGTELWSKRFLAEWKKRRKKVRSCCWWLTWKSHLGEHWIPVYTASPALEQQEPWSWSFLRLCAKEMLRVEKKKRQRSKPAFYHVFCHFFLGGGRSMGDVFWKVRILWIFDDLQNVYVFLSSQVHSSKNYLYNNTTPEVFALSSTGTSILRKPSICQLVELAEKWQLSLNAYSIRPSENFRKHSGP